MLVSQGVQGREANGIDYFFRDIMGQLLQNAPFPAGETS